MSNNLIPILKIGELEAKVPIVQGGMGVGISMSNLSSAVANAGGIGVISSAEIGMIEPDFNLHPKKASIKALRKEIRKARSMTNGIIGVNIMVAMSDFNEMAIVSLEEGVDILFIGAGLLLKNPLNLVKDKNLKTKIVPIVSSARAFETIFKYWARHYNRIPDAVVVEGPKAGGHLGFKEEQIDNPDYKLEKIVPEVIASAKVYEKKFNKSIPVIPAGGIYTGEDIYKFIKMGASGVQMATRFVATYECDASEKFKEAYVNCKKEDITIIKSPVGMPGRAIKNRFLENVRNGITKPFKCTWQCLKGCNYRSAPYCITQALVNAQKGNLDDGFAFAGSNAYRINKIVSVQELIDELIDGYSQAASKFN